MPLRGLLIKLWPPPDLAPSKSPPGGETLASGKSFFKSPPYRGGFRRGVKHSACVVYAWLLSTLFLVTERIISNTAEMVAPTSLP